jgi:hypothetical protein
METTAGDVWLGREWHGGTVAHPLYMGSCHASWHLARHDNARATSCHATHKGEQKVQQRSQRPQRACKVCGGTGVPETEDQDKIPHEKPIETNQGG